MHSLYIAIRLKRLSDAVHGFNEHDTKVIDSNIERRSPALKNISQEFYDSGMEYEIDGHKLFWLHVEGPSDAEYFSKFNEVECVFDQSWFDGQQARIRSYAGMAYYDACAEIAKDLGKKPQDREIAYSI